MHRSEHAQMVLMQRQWVPAPSPRRPRQPLRFYGKHKQDDAQSSNGQSISQCLVSDVAVYCV